MHLVLSDPTCTNDLDFWFQARIKSADILLKAVGDNILCPAAEPFFGLMTTASLSVGRYTAALPTLLMEI